MIGLVDLDRAVVLVYMLA